tara:strand:- start:334 stop:630 length:297 start_codon:yes stop_codon:yes gene_type:complete
MMIHNPLANFRLMLAYSRAHCGYDTARFMSGDYGSVNPADTGTYAASRFKFAAVRPEVRAAYAGRLDLQNNITRTRCRIRKVHEFQLAVSKKDDPLHL